jgi:drug/metabolite transporter (DMT)-like permease
VLRERAGWIQITGTCLAAAGVLLVISKGDFQSAGIGTIGSFGDLLILISAVNWAVFSVLSRKILLRLPASLMMFYVMFFGFVFSSLLFLFQTGFQDIENISSSGVIAILVLGVFGSGLAYIAWYDALQYLPSNQAGVFLYIEPLVTLIVAFLILGEPITWASLLGGAVIILGVWMVNRKPVAGS